MAAVAQSNGWHDTAACPAAQCWPAHERKLNANENAQIPEVKPNVVQQDIMRISSHSAYNKD